jgi:anti-sigma B factor antagonist
MSLADLQLGINDGVVRAALTGEVDMSNSDHLGKAITHGTPNEAIGTVLDLSAVDYLDSAGIHLLYRLRENLRVRGQHLLVVIPPGSPVNDALRLAGVIDHIEAFENVADATQSLLAKRTG